jgi:hypothetical protein
MEPATLRETLERAAPQHRLLPVENAAGERLRSAARMLPAALSNRLYLESSLNGAGRVDLIVQVHRERSMWLRPLRDLARPWEPVGAFARRWHDGEVPSVASLWLELDLPPGQAMAAPRVFFDCPGSASSPLAPGRSLLGVDPPVELLAALKRCWAHLPSGARLPSFGLSRIDSWSSVRLCIAGLRDRDLAEVLDGMGWPGDAEALARRHASWAARLEARGSTLSLLHLDLAPSMGARLGIEYSFAAREKLAGDRFLDALVEEGLCSPAWRLGLLRWPGHGIDRLPHELWPSLVVRRLNHIKLVYDDRGVVEAKAYLRVCHAYHASRPAPRLYR